MTQRLAQPSWILTIICLKKSSCLTLCLKMFLAPSLLPMLHNLCKKKCILFSQWLLQGRRKSAQKRLESVSQWLLQGKRKSAQKRLEIPGAMKLPIGSQVPPLSCSNHWCFYMLGSIGSRRRRDIFKRRQVINDFFYFFAERWKMNCFPHSCWATVFNIIQWTVWHWSFRKKTNRLVAHLSINRLFSVKPA